MIALTEIASFLDEYLSVQRFPDEAGGVFRPVARPVQRLGLALEAWPGMRSWADGAQMDALFLHRPWTLKPEDVAADVGILGYHLPFNERLTLSYNPELAEALGLSEVERLGEKDGHRLGMMGNVSRQTVAEFYHRVRRLFGSCLDSRTCEANAVTRVAVAGLMTSALVHEASTRGADVYITDEYRPTARRAVLDTGIGVIAVGHRCSEEWGLRALAAVLHERWPDLETLLAPSQKA